MKHNSTNAFITAIQKIDILEGWTPKAPTHIFYHSILDEVAFYDNSVLAYNTFHQKGGNVQLINLGNYTMREANLKAVYSKFGIGLSNSKNYTLLDVFLGSYKFISSFI